MTDREPLGLPAGGIQALLGFHPGAGRRGGNWRSLGPVGDTDKPQPGGFPTPQLCWLIVTPEGGGVQGRADLRQQTFLESPCAG